MARLTIQELDQFLSKQGADFEILHHEKPIKSRYDALNYFRLEEMAPTLIVRTEKGMFAIIISGAREKVDFAVIARQMNCSEMHLASKDEVLEVVGMKPGEVALVGHDLPCIFDQQLFQNEYLYGGTGDACHTLKIKPTDLLKISKVVFQFN